jgi:ubiquinone/menaquinone biosynthesis C-methylase UbiE
MNSAAEGEGNTAQSLVRDTADAVRHERDVGESSEAVVERLASSFDRAAAISPAASVALSSMGDEEKLAAITDEIVGWLQARRVLGSDRDILDIGCGIGRFEQALSGLSRRIVGIDISRQMLTLARNRCAGLNNVEFRLGSGLDLSGQPDNSFDCVLAVDSFPYLVLAGLAEKHIHEAARVLRPQGNLIILNYSYRDSLRRDLAEIRRLAASCGLSLNAGRRHPFRLWDGKAFHLSR